MDIYLIGYMASGKSTVGPLIASLLGYDFIDFDAYVVAQEGRSIPEIFESKGEIYFRKKEALYLNEILTLESDVPKVVALGGGTPCYGNNLQQLQNANIITVYLNLGVELLSKRLWETREGRPVVAQQNSYEALEEFVRKHLFERGFYYNQARHVITVKIENQEPEIIAKQIVELL